MLWRRYRTVTLLAVPLGFLLGAIVIMVFTGPGYLFEASGVGPLMLVTAGGIGAVHAGAAVLGGFVALVRGDRTLQREPSQRVWLGSIGAGLGVICGWAVVGLFGAVAEENAYVLLTVLPPAIVCGVVAASISGIAVSRSERAVARLASTAPPSSRTTSPQPPQ